MSKEVRVPIINANACGIDVGSRAHYVAVGQGSEAVKSFGVYTKDHHEMVEYLKEQGVKRLRWKAQAIIGKRFLQHWKKPASKFFWYVAHKPKM